MLLCYIVTGNLHTLLYTPKSGLIDGKKVQAILEAPENHIESKDFFSWERFFTSLLVSETKGSYLQYSKEHLNEIFLHDKERRAILKVMEPVIDGFILI